MHPRDSESTRPLIILVRITSLLARYRTRTQTIALTLLSGKRTMMRQIAAGIMMIRPV